MSDPESRINQPFMPGDEAVIDMVARFVAAGQQLGHEGQAPVGSYTEHYEVAQRAAATLLRLTRVNAYDETFDLVSVDEQLRTQLAQGDE